MDFAQVINELWRRRGWVVLGAVVALVVALSTAYHLTFFPPSAQEKTLSLGTASTQILIDTPESALTDLGISFKPLAERAGVYARFMTSRPVRAAIAQEVGLDESQILTEAPLAGAVTRAQREPVAAKRAGDLLGEGTSYRLRFQSDPGQPTISIIATAPRASDAVRLADAAAAGFGKYVKAVQQRQRVPDERRVQVRQLGAADGGNVVKEINRPLAAFAFIGAFIAWCLLVLLVSSVARSVREIREGDRGVGGPTTGDALP